MDHTKLRLISGAAGVLLGLGGIFALFVAATLALAEIMGLTAAAFVVAGAGVLLALICLVICFQPFRSMEDEVGSVEDATAETLADLPFETVRAFIERRPLTTTALAMALGYSVIRHPHAAQRQAERFVLSML